MEGLAAVSNEGDVRFWVTYDGPAVDAGRMDARDLAPAMYSVALLVEHAAGLTFGSTTGLKIDVGADFRRGSFTFEIITRPESVEKVKAIGTLLASTGLSVAGLKFLLEVLGVKLGADGGVLGLLRWLRGRKVVETKPVDNDRVQIIVQDGGSITVNTTVYHLSRNPTVRRDIEGIVKPLERPGIEAMTAGEPDRPAQTVRKDEVEYFRAPVPTGELLQDTVRDELLEVVGPSFKEGNKWQFARPGDSSFHAAILDKSFLQRVRRQDELFGAGDVLKVRMRDVVTRAADGKLSAQREIVEVLDHQRPRLNQTSLFDADTTPYREDEDE
jgi:hypothetical protein